MRIVYHLGAHCTDEERLLRALLKNRGVLAAEGIVVPGPARYRTLLRDTAMQLRGAAASRDTQTALLDQIMDEDSAERLILSWDNFIGFAQSALGDMLYPAAGERMLAFRNIFPDLPHEFHLGLRNPATFVPAILDKTRARVQRPDGPPDARRLRWSDLVLSLRAAVPDAPVTVWCDEDTPLLWPTVLARVSGHAEGTVLEDIDDLLGALMGPAGLARLQGYLADHPPADAAHRARVVAAFLDKFALPDAVSQELDVPGWTAATVADLTAEYDRDIARLMRIEGVTVLAP